MSLHRVRRRPGSFLISAGYPELLVGCGRDRLGRRSGNRVNPAPCPRLPRRRSHPARAPARASAPARAPAPAPARAPAPAPARASAPARAPAPARASAPARAPAPARASAPAPAPASARDTPLPSRLPHQPRPPRSPAPASPSARNGNGSNAPSLPPCLGERDRGGAAAGRRLIIGHRRAPSREADSGCCHRRRSFRVGRPRNPRVRSAIASGCSSRAKWPASRMCTSAAGTSLR